jgi:protein TonB
MNSAGDPGRYSAAAAGRRRARPRWGTLALVALAHLAALAGLVQVFAPSFTASAIERVGSLVTVTVTTPPDPPAPSPEPEPEPALGDPGDEGQEAPRAEPQEVTAPPAPLPISRPLTTVAASGDDHRAGSGETGAGSGAGAGSDGPGSGGPGVGTGSGSRALELLSGSIDNARDYPTPPGGRRVRRGHDVVIELTIGPDGRVQACRITDPSPDPEADAITCRLATERFVFRPRLDAAGNPISGRFRWRQRWF